jgi:hypothetical protein
MDFSFAEEQEQIEALAKEFCQREADSERFEEIAAKTYAAKEKSFTTM